jgi:two-component system, chemotaxis family, chemotaxis protein CheY
MPKRILIADDNETIRTTIRLLLDSRDYEVCAEAANGRQAVEMALATNPDLLLLDVFMPYLTGPEVAVVLKYDLPNAKMILFSMFGEYVGEYAATVAGVNMILPKELVIKTLLRAVGTLLAQPSTSR